MTTTDIATPMGEQERISALDVARGFALFGILIMNSTGMALPVSGFVSYAVGGDGFFNIAAWGAMLIYFEGAMRGLFSLLFGAGLVIFLDRLDAKGVINGAEIHARRMLWLILFGIINALVFLYPYDILLIYGVVGLFLFPMRKLGPRTLFGLGIGVAAVLTVLSVFDGLDYRSDGREYYELQEQRAAGLGLDDDELERLEELQSDWDNWTAEPYAIEEEREAFGDGLVGYASALWGDWAGFMTSEFLWFLLFDAACMIFIGMSLARGGVLLNQASTSFYLGMLIIGYGGGIFLGLLRIYWLEQAMTTFGAGWQEFLLYQPRRALLAVGHVGLVFMVVRAGLFTALQSVLGAVGRMAFTNYLMQSVIQVLIWAPGFLGLYGKVERHQVWLVVFAIWALQGFFSVWWLARYRYGPLEWVWRGLTYAQFPPLRRKPGATTHAGVPAA